MVEFGAYKIKVILLSITHGGQCQSDRSRPNCGLVEVTRKMNVFFYGLFMDEDLLARKGISARSTAVGHVDGFQLRIGERATLLRSAGARAYGVVMEISPDEAKDLYAQSGVADYVPERVTVQLIDGSEVEASCYNLPAGKISGTNKEYAKALWEVANKLDLPEPYLAEIRRAAS